jgi:hypothetical protein
VAIASKDFGQTGVSCGQGRQFTFTIRRERQTGANVFERQIGEFGRDLFGRHSTRQIFQHTCHSRPQAANAGLPLRLSGSIVMTFV